MLTPAQYQTLKTNIAASEFSGLPHNDDSATLIAGAYNIAASPTFTVWKTLVPISQVGEAFNGTELSGLTTGNQSRLQTLAIYLANGVNPSKAGVRGFFDDVFSGAGGTNTRVSLLALWKRPALRAEKLFADTSGGDGSTATPALLVFEGLITYQDVTTAWNS